MRDRQRWLNVKDAWLETSDEVKVRIEELSLFLSSRGLSIKKIKLCQVNAVEHRFERVYFAVRLEDVEASLKSYEQLFEELKGG